MTKAFFSAQLVALSQSTAARYELTVRRTYFWGLLTFSRKYRALLTYSGRKCSFVYNGNQELLSKLTRPYVTFMPSGGVLLDVAKFTRQLEATSLRKNP